LYTESNRRGADPARPVNRGVYMDLNQYDKIFSNYMRPKQIKIVFLNDEINHTEYFYGTHEELKKSILILVEQNRSGDCLCQVNGAFMVSVDHRDVKAVV
jgi:hypothetical protein